MSGFAAFMALGGDPADAKARTQAMLAAMQQRGAHGRTVLAAGGVALGQTAQDDAGSGGPWQRRAGGPILSGTVRLDNAADLRARLGLSDVPDGVVVLAAYDRWGLDLPQHLDGDFALVLWDPAAGRLLGLRDRFGVRPFLFRATPQVVAAASDAGALLAAFPASTPPLDEIWIAEFLSGQPTSASRTIHRGVSRLEPAHMLLVENGRIETRRYWELNPEPKSMADPPEALLEELDQAVLVRMRNGPVGAMLSGGLDSSTLSVLASRHSAAPLPTISMKFDRYPEIDECEWIAKVHAAGRFRPIWIDVDTLDGGIDELLAEQGTPFFAPNLPTSRSLYRAAAEAGLRGLIDGHGGDEVISFGLSRLAELAGEGQWRALWSATRAASALGGDPRRDIFLRSVVQGARSRWLRAAARRLSRAEIDRTAWRRAVHADLVARTDLVDRVRKAAATPPPGATVDMRQHIGLLTAPRFATALEILDRAAACRNVVPLYPFLDRRVVEHCVAQPCSAKFHDGMARALLRDATRGVLPEAVRLRIGKSDFTAHVRARLLAGRDGDLARLLGADPGPVAEYADLGTIREGAGRLRTGEVDAGALQEIIRVLVLDRWLRRTTSPADARLDQRTPA
ncbi:asparagine synthase-related protein [Rhodobacter sp. CZR27]|uniref:asparagine synthase-related protein n=1 Tax=Rhodobacter sp. CZR27 TaxID=2033869 RepID=UPI000BBE5475|nr:asparagine synthase-related protein [Rhodobacter sp. CZR27]